MQQKTDVLVNIGLHRLGGKVILQGLYHPSIHSDSISIFCKYNGFQQEIKFINRKLGIALADVYQAVMKALVSDATSSCTSIRLLSATG